MNVTLIPDLSLIMLDNLWHSAKMYCKENKFEIPIYWCYYFSKTEEYTALDIQQIVNN